MTDPTLYGLGLAASVIGIGYLAQRIMMRWGIPDSMSLIALGILLGPVLGIVDKSAFLPFVPYAGALALISIMFESGLDIDLYEMVKTSKNALFLAVLSFLASVAGVVFFVHYLLGVNVIKSILSLLKVELQQLSVKEALLLGTIIGGGSGVIIASVARKARLTEETRLVLTIESMLTDVLCIVGASALVLLFVVPTVSPEQVSAAIASKFGVSLLTGFIVGLGISWLLARGHTYSLILAILLFLYSGTEYLQGSGAIAVFIAALVPTNLRYLPAFATAASAFQTRLRSESLGELHSELSLLIRVFFFIEIGLLFNVNLTSPTAMSSTLVGITLAALLLIVRYPAVALVAAASKRKISSISTVFYARGLAAAVLSVIPLQLGLPRADFYLQTVVGVIVYTNLIMSVLYPIIRRRASNQENSTTTKHDSAHQAAG